MRTLIASLLTLVALNINAGVWTFHAAKDNSVFVEVWDLSSVYPHFRFVCLQWDYDADMLTGDSWSGVFWWDGSANLYGWGETRTVDVPDSWMVDYASISGPYPDWDGNQEWLEDAGTAFPGAGEYWIDYDSSGVKRVSTSAPADFGKWAWDGSINPNYVEPLVVLKKGRKHRR